MKYIQF